MSYQQIFLLLAVFGLFMWFTGRRRALNLAAGRATNLHSLPGHYGFYSAIWTVIPALLFLLLWSATQNSITQSILAQHSYFASMDDTEKRLALNVVANISSGSLSSDDAAPEVLEAADYLTSIRSTAHRAGIVITSLLGILGAVWAFLRIAPTMRARNRVENVVRIVLMLCSILAIMTTLSIVLSVLFESIRFFQKVSPIEFFFSTHWSAQTAIRSDQVGASGSFGAIPLFSGTLLISAIAMVIAAPIGLLSAIYLAEYASNTVRSLVKPIIEILAGIPTVVYGFFAALTVAPFIRETAASLGLSASSESALAAGIVMGIMIVPFVSSISDDVISAVPQSLRDGAYGLGSTRSETIKSVIIPAALPGIVGGLLLAVSRAIGETMIVVMAAGLAANLTVNPLEAVTTVTVQIVTLLVGDQEFDSAKTLAAFALGLVLFCVTLILNIIALAVVRKYREQYD